MNFRGQYRKGRNINLGGKNSAATSRESILKKAQEDREKRETARSQEQAALRIQRFYRNKQGLFKLRQQYKQTWIEHYSTCELLADELDARYCINLFSFCSRAINVNTQDILMVENLSLLVAASDLPSKVSATSLKNLLSSLSGILETFYSAEGHSTTKRYLLQIINCLPDFIPQSLYRSIGSLIQKEISDSGSSYILNTCGQSIARLSGKYRADFVGHFLLIPRLSSLYQTYLDQSLSILLSNSSNDTPAFTANFPQEKNARLWILTNVVFTLGKHNVSINGIKLIGEIVAHSDLVIINPSSKYAEDFETDDEGIDSAEERHASKKNIVVIQDTLQNETIDSLYTRSFVITVFSLLTDSQYQAANINLVASLFVSLIGLYPSHHRDILLYLSVLSDGSASAVRAFWQSFKTSQIFDIFSKGIIDSREILSIGANDQGWSKLILSLELYSYWLIVADDSEFLSNSSHGLDLDAVKHLSQVLKNLCFSLIWNWAKLEEGPSDMFSMLKKLKSTSLVVIRQIYVRDSRRPFLGKDFWLMVDNFNMEVFIPMVVEEHERQREADNASDDEFSVALGDLRNKKRPAGNHHQLALAPRLELLRQVPFFMPFDVRVHVFQAFIELDRSRVEQQQANDDWRSMFMQQPKINVNIRRDNLLSDAYEALKDTSGSDFKLPIAVRFHNEYGPEAGIDGGGLTKEFLTSVCQDGFIQGGGLDLFETTRSHQLYPNPIYGVSKKMSELDPEQAETALHYYNFLGKVIGKCLYKEILVDTEFAPFFLQKWAAVGRSDKNTFDDLYSLDPEIYDNLVKLHKYNGDVENDLNLDFTVTQDVGHGIQRDVELKPGGSSTPVTSTNRLEYIHSIANYKLNTVLAPQTTAFIRGIASVISLDWLGMFNASELQMLISGGRAAINIDDLQANTVYSNGFHTQHPTIVAFWGALREMSEEDKCLFIKFVTSVPKAPLLGFRQLNPKLAIHNAGSDLSRLPTASTCVNMLKLPDFRDKKLLKEKLAYSIRAEAGFDLS